MSVSLAAASRPLRVFVAALAHQTNSFSPVPTSLRSFQQDGYDLPPADQGREAALKAAGYGDAIRIAKARGNDVVEGPCLWTQPSAPVSAPLYQQLREALPDRLRDAGPLDMVLLVFHAALMAPGTDDCEGDLLAAVREIVGTGTTSAPCSTRMATSPPRWCEAAPSSSA